MILPCAECKGLIVLENKRDVKLAIAFLIKVKKVNKHKVDYQRCKNCRRYRIINPRQENQKWRRQQEMLKPKR